jgi:uncharacterized membrane protein YphA (DoxX/SURF4 family)
MRMPSHWTYAAWVTLLRVYAGVFWIVHGVPKFLNGPAFMPPKGYFAEALSRALPMHHGAYHVFLANVVAPNAYLFAELTRLGEVLTGCALLLGVFTRFGGLVGCFLAANYFMINGEFGNWRNLGSLEATAFVLSFMFLAIPAGRVAGVDALLYRRPLATVRRDEVLVPEVVDEPPPAPPQAPSA